MENPKRKGGPRQRRTKQAEGNQQYFNLQKWQQSFDVPAFNHLIESQGVLVTHYRAIPDPTGMGSSGDIYALQSKRQSSDGFLYKKVGKLYITFNNNTSDWNIDILGMTKHDVAIATPAMKYEDCDNPVLLAPYDRFFIEDIELRVIATQYVEANSIGIDKLQYPATCVEHLVDADGLEYQENTHFIITPEGHIKWLTQARPGWNPDTLRGTVYSIRYRYTPYYVVARMLYETRVSQVTNPTTFQRRLERMPYHVMMIRENVLSDQNNDEIRGLLDNRFQPKPPFGQNDGNNGPDGGKL